MFRLCCLAVVLLQGFLFIQGDMTLRVLGPKLFSTIECVSMNDMTITFLDRLNTTRKVAECDTSVKRCFLREPALGQYYAVFYSESGTIFRILNETDKTSGVYTCCETYNSTNCAGIVIMHPAENSSKEIPNTDIDATSNCSSFLNTAKELDQIKSSIDALRVGAILVISACFMLISGLLLVWFKRSCLQKGQHCKQKKQNYVPTAELDEHEQLANAICELLRKQYGQQRGIVGNKNNFDSGCDNKCWTYTSSRVFQTLQSRCPFKGRENDNREAPPRPPFQKQTT